MNSNWLRAELAVGLVQRIEKKCRFIPIVLDNVEVPVALQGTLQRRIADVDDYAREFDALLRSIFQRPTTPPLGRPPTYTAAPRMTGLTAADASVFVQLGELAVENGTFFVDGGALHERCTRQGLSDRAVIEAIHAIDQLGLIKEARTHGGLVRNVHIRPRMLREHIAMTTDVNALERRLIAEIVNGTGTARPELGEIARQVGVDTIAAQALLDRLDGRLFTLSARLGGQIYVDGISPLLARELD